MDLSKIKPSERVVEITHPGTDKEVGVKVSLVSLSDPKLVKIKRGFQDAKLRLEAKGKNFKADDIEDNRNALAFGAMTGWDWYGEDVSFDGEKPQFNQANVYKVFSELPWFRDQIEEEISDNKAFF